ncbi:1916_t:CDS:2, partial [Dentiscutata heterogama]
KVLTVTRRTTVFWMLATTPSVLDSGVLTRDASGPFHRSRLVMGKCEFFEIMHMNAGLRPA